MAARIEELEQKLGVFKKKKTKGSARAISSANTAGKNK